MQKIKGSKQCQKNVIVNRHPFYLIRTKRIGQLQKPAPITGFYRNKGVINRLVHDPKIIVGGIKRFITEDSKVRKVDRISQYK